VPGAAKAEAVAASSSRKASRVMERAMAEGEGLRGLGGEVG